MGRLHRPRSRRWLATSSVTRETARAMVASALISGVTPKRIMA